MAANAVKMNGGGLIAASLPCKICGAVATAPGASLKGVEISATGATVVLSEADVALSQGDTIKWSAAGTVKWRVDFTDVPFKPTTFSGKKSGFKDLALPAGQYRYKAHIEGVATSADGVITVS